MIIIPRLIKRNPQVKNFVNYQVFILLSIVLLTTSASQNIILGSSQGPQLESPKQFNSSMNNLFEVFETSESTIGDPINSARVGTNIKVYEMYLGTHNVYRFHGNGTGLNLNGDTSINFTNHSIIQILDAPNSLISDLILINTSIEFIDSPYAIVEKNEFRAMNSQDSRNFLSFINSSYSIVRQNVIQFGEVYDGDLHGIYVSNSNNMTISDNQISSFVSKISSLIEQTTSAITIQNSSNSVVLRNTISDIFSPYSIGVLILNSMGVSARYNQIKNIYNSNHSRVESFGFLVIGSKNSIIANNIVSDILSITNSFRTLAFAMALIDSITTIIEWNQIDNVDARSVIPNSFGVMMVNDTKITISHNSINNIYTETKSEDRAFATGIYVDISEYIDITNNSLTNLVSLGRSAYGIYVARSDIIYVNGNSISDLLSEFNYFNRSNAIIIRISNNSHAIGNVIENILSVTKEIVNPSRLPSASGIFFDAIVNSSILNNHISNIVTSSINYPADSLGIIGANSLFIEIKSNFVSRIYGTYYDSIATGISLKGIYFGLVEDNRLEQVQAQVVSFDIYNSYTSEILFYNNSLVVSGMSRITYGMYIVQSFNQTISANVIEMRHTAFQGSSMVIKYTNLFTISHNKLIDKYNNSVGMLLDYDTSGVLSKNEIKNFPRWMYLSSTSEEVSCTDNFVDNVVIMECLKEDLVDPFNFNPNTSLITGYQYKRNSVDKLSEKLIIATIITMWMSFLSASAITFYKRKRIQ